jgi:replicative superfamily II helicase
LYSAFPVESCLEHRIHENLNAEIASGTIHNISDCVGYLSWTYYARRVKKNPIFYGAESSRPEHIEAQLFNFVKESIATLRSEGCVEIQDLDAFSEIDPTPLGIAASQYYLSHRTPKQMQVGIREGRKIILKAMKNNVPISNVASIEGVLQPFTQPHSIDEPSIAWLLFALCSTHEFDELPVRHNEEHLNEDLSKDVIWGPDVADVLSGNKSTQRQYRNPEIYLDPHTKAFILVQAHLEYTKLPISDYVNDTKSVMENLPRILAAMSYIAATAECEVEGSFELLTQFSRTRQLLMSRCKVDDDPLQQLPGINAGVVQQIQSSQRNGGRMTLHQLRSLQRKDANQQMQHAFHNSTRLRTDEAINKLYGYPLITATTSTMIFKVDKQTNKSIGKLILSIDIDRTNHSSSSSNTNTNGSKDSNTSITLMVLLGSYHQRFLLSSSTIRIVRYGTWTIQKELVFDWNKAKSDGDSDKVIVRFMFDEIRGLDLEMIINMT